MTILRRTGGRTSRASLIRWLGWAAVGGLLIAALAAPGAATSTDAPGNNGTVKIHDTATDTEPIVHNEPHVCTFHLHFFFADPFQAGTWEIQEWSPGDMGTLVLSGMYDTNGDGEDRDPDAGAYSLPEGHYKLFWDGDLDTAKHDKMKVFWVDCVPATEVPETEVPATEAPETEAPSFEQTAAPETEAPSFEQTAAPETEAPSFGQSLGAETDVPGGGLTQPPTDMASSGTAPDPGGWRWLLVVMAAMLSTVLVLTPSERSRRR